METTRRTFAILTAFLAGVGALAQASEKAGEKANQKIVMKASNGRFLRPTDGGNLLADRLFPTERDTFELLTGEGNWAALRACDGRFLVVRRSVPVQPPKKPIEKIRAKLDKRVGRKPPAPASQPVWRPQLVAFDVPAAAAPIGEGDPAAPAYDDPSVPAKGEPVAPRNELIGLPEQAVLLLVPQKGNAAAITATRNGPFAVFHGTPKPADKDAAGPRPAETVEIYRAGKVPSTVRSALSLVIAGLVMEKLGDEEYDNVESRRKQKYIELPAPTLRDPARKKKHRVLSYEEEYHVNARLGGEPVVRITHMPHLKGHFNQGTSLLMFAVEASIPVRGRVRYRIPDRLSASTGFETTVELSLVGQVYTKKSKDWITVDPPEVLDIQISLRELKLSNDVLNAARQPIEDFINGQLVKKNGRIRHEANEILAKAVEAREFRHPLLRFVALP